MTFFKKYFKGDPHIWAIIVGLSVFSVLVVYSATGALAYRTTGGNTAFHILRHSRHLAAGLAVTFVLHMFPPYRYYARISQWLLWITIPLLIYTMFFGVEENDAFRRISVLGLTFQSSDLAKMALIMYLSRRLALRQDEINIKKTDLLMFFLIGFVCALILPSNFSTAAMLFVVCVLLLFVARVSLKHLTGFCIFMIIAGTVAVAGLYGLQKAGMNNVFTQRATTWVNRIDRHFDKSHESNGLAENYQALQAKIAIGTGGIIGKGPGNSVQRNYLPHAYSDYIFAIIIEEYGVIGGLVVLSLYLSLLYRAIVIVRKCDKTFPAFLVMGLSLMVVFQAFVNMAVAVGLMPVTGQPLPLISMGGTSIVFTGAAFGIILNVSREMSKKEEATNRKTAGNKPTESEPESLAEEK